MIRINADGTADLILVGTESGSGQYTALSMMVAEELGLPLEKVTREVGDTELFPNQDTRFTVTIAAYGEPTRIAAVKAREALLEVVADKLEANVQDLECKDGRVCVKGSPDKGMPFAEAARIAVAQRGPIVGRGETIEWGYGRYGREGMAERFLKFGFLGTSPGMTFGVAGAEVEVDKETGIVRVLRLAHAYDVGFAVNPLAVEEQLEGGAGQGIGGLLTEEVQAHDGQIVNSCYANYKLLTALDMPEVISIIIEENDPRDVPYGVKELGMGALCAPGAAVVNAIYDATGVMLNEYPATPERILRALEAREKGPSK